jgi:nitrous oxide reductase
MTKKATTQQPRREFLKLAAFTGAAALTGEGPAAPAEQTATPQAADA